jgi:uncharacterized phage protein (TIGR01671 family)
MKELKFRAFVNGKMRYDVTGFEHGEKNEMTGVFLNGDDYRIGPDCLVMQATGVVDKNGKDIYEGDLVNYLTNHFITKDEGGGFMVKQEVKWVRVGYDFGEWGAEYATISTLVVTGNIYELSV